MIITCITSTAANGTTRTGYYTGTKAAAMEAAEAKFPGYDHRLVCRYEGTEIPETETDQEPEETTKMIIITKLVPASINSRQAGSVRPSGGGVGPKNYITEKEILP